MEKLRIHYPCTEIILQFKAPNINISPVEICDDEDLDWYMSIDKETAEVC